MEKLFEQTTLAGIEVSNRFMRSGTWTELASEEGAITPELMDKYRLLAEGEIGLVIAGYARVNEFERANNNMISVYNDKFIEGLTEFTDMFHQNNTPIGIQLAMGGTQIHYNGDVDWEVMSPSHYTGTYRNAQRELVEFNASEMTVEQIKLVIKDFADAAKRVKQSGFDMVQIHAGHGYFISQWMNPNLNNRTDEYGQDPAKFIIELYSTIRESVGVEFPIGIKINSEETIGDDSNHARMLDLCTRLDKLGINMIEVSGTNPSRNKLKVESESYFASFANKLTNVVNCDVVLTGGNKTLSNFAQIQKETEVGFIGLSRPLVSEPDLIKKWKQDREYKSRCISCNHCHRKTYVCVFDK